MRFRTLVVAAGVLVTAGCGGGSSAEGATLETLAPAASSSSTSTTAPTTTSSSTTTSTSTTTTEVVADAAVGVFDYGDYELLWAQEGTEEADVERAFWRSEEAAQTAFISENEAGLDEAFAGEALQWQLDEVVRIRELGGRIEDKGTREYELGFVVLVDDSRAQIQVCLFDTNVWYNSHGDVASDSLTPYEVSYVSMLSKSPEGEWFVVSGTTDFDRPLAEGARPSCFSDT